MHWWLKLLCLLSDRIFKRNLKKFKRGLSFLDVSYIKSFLAANSYSFTPTVKTKMNTYYYFVYHINFVFCLFLVQSTQNKIRYIHIKNICRIILIKYSKNKFNLRFNTFDCNWVFWVFYFIQNDVSTYNCRNFRIMGILP